MDVETKYGKGINWDNPHSSHTMMVGLVGNGKSVLEFGCSTGYMSKVLRERGCRVTGVELDRTAAKEAAAVCERVIVADLDTAGWEKELEARSFNVAIFGDVLEHLKDPVAALEKTRGLLTPDGYVVASIPNIAHGSVRLSLLEGRFDYQRLGLLDDTHLRFFTRQSVEQLFAEAGFIIQEMQRTKLGIFDAEIRSSRDAFDAATLSRLEGDEEALTYQFVCRAAPAAHSGIVRTLYDNLRSRGQQLEESRLAGKRLEQNLAAARKRITDLHLRLEQLDEKLVVSDATLTAVLNSRGWRLLNRYRDFKNKIRKTFVWNLSSRWKPQKYPIPALDPQLYQEWIQRFERTIWSPEQLRETIKDLTYQPKISIIMPVFNTPLEYLERAINSVAAQVYENWELCICDDGSQGNDLKALLQSCRQRDPRIKVTVSPENEGISAASNHALELATGEFIGLLDHDDELSPHALYECVELLQSHPEADIIYTDEDKLEADGRRSEPFFKPDWSPEYLLSCMYTCHFGLYRRDHVSAVGGFRTGFEGSQDYDLVLRLVERTHNIFHVPKILYHWRKSAGSTAAVTTVKYDSMEAGRKALEEHMQRRGIPAVVSNSKRPNLYRVQPRVEGEPLVSIIIPTKDGAPILRRCVHSIEKETLYRNFEILIVDNNSSSKKAREYFASLPHRVIQFAEPFNFSRINNFAVRHARGNYLVFLNNDTEVIAGDWLTAMLEFCQMPDVGIVGTKLYYPNKTIQHAGVILGIGGVAGHSHKYLAGDSSGYFDALDAVRNYSAVTAACMMVKRDVFEKVKGFDENLSVAFNDVDFCMRVRDAGFRIVWTPYAELYHHESATRGYALDAKEVAYMKARWGTALVKDPYYNPNLTLFHENFGLQM